MTTRPRFYHGSKVHGLLALALFGILAGIFLAAEFGDPQGFPGVDSITAAIGFAMFDIQSEAVPEGTEAFLVAFIVIAVVLDAALDAAVMLARREEEMSLPFASHGAGTAADGTEGATASTAGTTASPEEDE